MSPHYTQGSYAAGTGMTAHYKDLREMYAKRMECHGMGLGLMQPISGKDCMPVCCGYFDRNGDWNLITKLTTEKSEEGWIPLEHEPTKSTDVSIEWQPKTALGMQAVTIDTSAESPDNLPGGAEGRIRYTSNNKFGAVLMTLRPITLHAYNDERLFMHWLDTNKELLYTRFGTELKKYGMWIVTRTYNAPGASINAWLDKKKDAVVSAKAKANMLGELGNEFNMAESMTDRDWSHYRAKTAHGLVVFMDGIEVPAFDWWKEGLRFGVFGATNRVEDHIDHTRRASSVPRNILNNMEKENLLLAPTPPPQLELAQSAHRSPASRYRAHPWTLVADDEVLLDAGFKDVSRTASLRRVSYTPSLAPSVRSGTPSLRRETRSISRDPSISRGNKSP